MISSMSATALEASVTASKEDNEPLQNGDAPAHSVQVFTHTDILRTGLIRGRPTSSPAGTKSLKRDTPLAAKTACFHGSQVMSRT